ncbi:PREDICTED: E3 ubiquitin-protein ligase HUWE1-like [Priapulus caudatus]|uniref:E3 ubiquitin-protein ligase HUWE1-like n=1 Tax=Priapulus caudatus TaxID=37621 RepID=A0ABM1F3W6_PRICU|nr:PREDICTED: E3 ubiquitin-protein ligase HUWE1-like [Priapulus caudatus]
MNIVSTVIENCPSVVNHTPQIVKSQQGMNSMIKILIKKGLVTDLARIAHNLDLSSPNMVNTINSALKPLETISRVVNNPSPTVKIPVKGKMVAGGNGGGGARMAAVNGAHSQNADDDAQDEGATDAAADMHDVYSAAAAVTSEETQRVIAETASALEDIVDQLLDRAGGARNAETLADVLAAGEGWQGGGAVLAAGEGWWGWAGKAGLGLAGRLVGECWQ